MPRSMSRKNALSQRSSANRRSLIARVRLPMTASRSSEDGTGDEEDERPSAGRRAGRRASTNAGTRAARRRAGWYDVSQASSASSPSPSTLASSPAALLRDPAGPSSNSGPVRSPRSRP